MGKIIQLEDHLSNKIAAGEVIERPASVVKELVENSIDANSTRIEVHVKEAGLSEIRIVDNGDGIEIDDCLLAFERHATSKIKNENDLFRIRTLGFRGEALPSIASVSELELKTCTGKGAGTFVHLNGGKLEGHQATNSRKGTDITVKNLFFNTPARLKYMKTIHTELGNITDYLNRISLAHPEISFQLTHNGKRLFFTSGNGDVRQVIASIYGLSIAKQMVPIKFQTIDYEINGWIARPEITRASRNYISTIINGRYIKNYALSKAIQAGYHTLLPIGRFPIVYINITMDPLLVDVNVHPSKLEVRLSKEMELSELITEGIRKTFRQERLIPEVKKQEKTQKPISDQQQLVFEHRLTELADQPKQNKQSLFALDTDEKQYEVEESTDVDMFETVQPYIEKHSVVQVIDNPPEKQNDSHLENAFIDDNEIVESVEQPLKAEERIPPLYPIGQMHGTYILAQNDRGLFIVDQHAAQERIKYEFFREKVGEIEPEVQEMLLPLTLEYTKNECLIIEEHMNVLEEVGIFLESFGSQSYIVRSHPQWFPNGSEQEIIEEIIQQVINKKKISIKELREEAAIMMSCKASIKANRHLRNDEIFTLLETLRTTTDPFTCPHGRPIIVHFSTYEMEKLFKRVM
ncbi:DNA mismatch repair endonuclease MutL [Bacillus sp. Marseille-P3661]|uniref:DNA mismatch repair endonuclease MutL n=1 Tax=Bacillus sp. Marseille-P3661 TaxID=1936234 RepID=UPI000C846CA8|nr:DNA mismatch repair endonuclease MutL [Bacillus sp. Marseille-P3661]